MMIKFFGGPLDGQVKKVSIPENGIVRVAVPEDRCAWRPGGKPSINPNEGDHAYRRCEIASDTGKRYLFLVHTSKSIDDVLRKLFINSDNDLKSVEFGYWHERKGEG